MKARIFAAIAATMIAVPAISAQAAIMKPAGVSNTGTAAPIIRVHATDAARWNKVFKRHTYTGQRFPYDLRGQFTGDPNMRVRDNRTTIGKTYQCTFYDDGRGPMIVCD